MPAKLTKPAPSGVRTAKNKTKVAAKVTHVETTALAQVENNNNPARKAALNPLEIERMVLESFRAAAAQMRARKEQGILESITPDAETVTDGTAIGPQSAQLVTIESGNHTNDGTNDSYFQIAEPQTASQGSYLYLPGRGFVYQEDNNELGH